MAETFYQNKKIKKVELLAPAGNFAALKGAVRAGADAVYLGGEQFGARAYADNFSREKILKGIHLAHVFGRKVYLTVNTLVKEKELDLLYDFLLPVYEKGLDGVIVQDLGALRFIRKHFPGMELHASTQMTLTGSYGARLLMREGVSRIVPARELSLEEIKRIKQDTGIEIETFIHGAMCYCYSGQCLLSSILGGRSGNRGRCAQPCRLPYSVDGGAREYPLSMRDLCTLSILPELIGAGIDSFKIEGRMKRPEYAAGVTAIYRKYIDLYYEDPDGWQIAPEDERLLHSLYIRSQVGEGYYHRRNGRELLTLDSPAYLETDEKLLKEIADKYLTSRLTESVHCTVTLKPDREASLLVANDQAAVTVTGGLVQRAQKQPLSGDKIKEQLKKDGGSLLEVSQVEIDGGEDIFMPVSALNELRRRGLTAMEEELIRRGGLSPEGRNAQLFLKEQPPERAVKGDLRLHASVMTREQLHAALGAGIERIYLDYGLFLSGGGQRAEELFAGSFPADKRANNPALYLAAPYVLRAGEERYLHEIKRAVEDGIFAGVLVRNLESFAFFEGHLPASAIILDAGVYVWNRESVRFFKGRAAELCLPAEKNAGEWRELIPWGREAFPAWSALVYGRLPVMVSAGCVGKTAGSCTHLSGFCQLKDRYGKIFPVYRDCNSCLNVIYNSVPLSLHKLFKDGFPELNCRLDFTVEDGRETGRILEGFGRLAAGEKWEPEYKEYTTGHYKRGVE